RRSCPHRPEPDRDVPKPGWAGCVRQHHEFPVYRRRAALGIKGQYALGDFQFIGEVAGAALIGTSKSSINFSTTSPSVGINNQALTSPDATRVIPSIDARLATAYTFPAGNYGLFRVEAGYRAAVYFDVINQYALTRVPTSLMLPP